MQLDPSQGTAGDASIVFVTADADLTAVDSMDFFGPSDLEIVASTLDASTLIITIDIPAGADDGGNDLVLGLDDGSTLFAEDAFVVR